MASRTLLSRKTLGAMLPRGAAGVGFSRGLGLCQLRKVQTFSLPDLPYDYSALEPAISGEIMRLHHQKHHQTYVSNFNKALEQLEEAMAKRDSATIVQLQGAIKFNGGSGHINHSIFWKNLAPIKEGGGEPPKGALGWAIDDVYGSPEAVIRKMNAEGAALQGSGWVWLALDKEMKKVTIETTANQEFYDSEEETGRDVLRGNEEDARRANSTSKFKFSKFGCRIWNLSGSYIISLLKRVSVNYMRQLRSSKRDDMQKDAQV